MKQVEKLEFERGNEENEKQFITTSDETAFRNF